MTKTRDVRQIHKCAFILSHDGKHQHECIFNISKGLSINYVYLGGGEGAKIVDFGYDFFSLRLRFFFIRVTIFLGGVSPPQAGKNYGAKVHFGEK